MPCSLGVIGYSSAMCTSSASSRTISKPEGARASAFTVPCTMSEDSCVKRPTDSHTLSLTSCFETTACTRPVPSLTCRKASLPLERWLYSQPRMLTVSPSWAAKSSI